ncbi:MAG TPA: NADH-quinone oxidoreductase subunit NuoE [bacterium]|nr:NADH-quinone oxidoreductase subunit NuoE [bacterium]
MATSIETILEQHPHAGRDSLIPILQEVQENEGFISQDAVVRISDHLGLAASKIYGVSTFYNQFRFHAPGRFHIQVCRGTACHVKGSAAVLESLMRALKLKSGETTRDGLFSLEVVACIGACGQAPVIAVNGEFHAKVTPDSVVEIIEDYRRQAAERS